MATSTSDGLIVYRHVSHDIANRPTEVRVERFGSVLDGFSYQAQVVGQGARGTRDYKTYKGALRFLGRRDGTNHLREASVAGRCLACGNHTAYCCCIPR